MVSSVMVNLASVNNNEANVELTADIKDVCIAIHSRSTDLYCRYKYVSFTFIYAFFGDIVIPEVLIDGT